MIGEQDWNQERSRLEYVREEIDREIKRLQNIVRHRRSEVLDIRRNFWDEVTVNTSDYVEVAETAASITQQSAVLSEQERNFRHAESTLRRLERLKPSPYFARIDFIESGRSQAEHIYIGIGSVIEEDTHELLVYDWRAPVSGMFYDYTPGPAQYETPEGIIAGEMTLKRQYIIKNGKLEDMFDTGINIGDDMLKVMLAKNAHEKMSSIVTTIQQEQNRIIRDDRHQILIVQGSAGSGKTSVALQRVAYLLYKYRKSLSADNMVLFSPNSIFNDYISHVLPELGEDNMQQTTFQDHLDRGFGKHFRVEDAYDQLEYLLTTPETNREYQVRVSGIAWKTSLSFMELLNRYTETLKREGMLFKPFVLRDKVLISSETLAGQFYHGYSGDSSIHSRLDKVVEWILQELDRFEERLFRNRFRKMANDPRYLGTDQEMKEESRKLARKVFAPLREMARKRTFVDVLGMYLRLLTDRRWMEKLGAGTVPMYEEIGRYTGERLAGGIVPYEDATPILHFKTAFRGMHKWIRIKQVIIDEAQDYSPFQLNYLRRLFPQARFTLLGDLNQGIYHANVQGYQNVTQVFQHADVGVVRMAKSYRSTNEIIDFTKRILQQPEPVEPIGRHGEPPRIIGVGSEEELVARVVEEIHRMQGKGAGSVAVICKTERETLQAYERLKGYGHQEYHLLTKNSLTFTGGIVVVPAYLAKGLEFDGVIVYNAGDEVYFRESERKLLYTACTRAMHWLSMFYTGKLTRLIG